MDTLRRREETIETLDLPNQTRGRSAHELNAKRAAVADNERNIHGWELSSTMIRQARAS